MSSVRYLHPGVAALLAATAVFLLLVSACENDDHFLCNPDAGDPVSAGCYAPEQVCTAAGYCTYRCDPKLDPKDQNCSDYETCSPDGLCVLKRATTDGGSTTDAGTGGGQDCLVPTDCVSGSVCMETATGGLGKTCHALFSTEISGDYLRVVASVDPAPLSDGTIGADLIAESKINNAIVLFRARDTWSSAETVFGASASDGAFPSATRDQDGVLLIAHTSPPTGAPIIEWATDAGTWSPQTTCNANPATLSADRNVIGMAADNSLFFAARGLSGTPGQAQIDVYRCDATGFTTVLTLSSLQGQTPLSLAIDSKSSVHVTGLSSLGKIAYATDLTDPPAPNNPPAFLAAGGTIPLALSSSDRVFIAYQANDPAVTTSLALTSIAAGDTSWSPDENLVRATENVAAGPGLALAIDSTGEPHIAYRDNTAKSLIYAYRKGGEWTGVELAALLGASSDPTVSLELDSSDAPHIAYIDSVGAIVYLRIQP